MTLIKICLPKNIVLIWKRENILCYYSYKSVRIDTKEISYIKGGLNMLKVFFSFKKHFIEHKLLILSVVLSLFMSSILKWSFFKYIVGILSFCMIMLDYKESLDNFLESKKLIYKKYIRNIFFLVDSLIEVFWILTKNEIFQFKEGVLKSTLITTISIIAIVNIVYALFLEKLDFEDIKWISIVLTLFIMNSNVINGTINSLYIIQSKDGLNLIITLIIVLGIFFISYYIFKTLILQSIKLKK